MMLGKIKMLIEIFEKVTVGVLLSAAIFITAFWGTDAELHIEILWQVLAVSAMCSLGILIFPSDSQKELSKMGMLLRQLAYFIYVNVMVLGFGNLFQWFSFHDWKMVLAMEALIVGVYLIVNVVNYLNDYTEAKSMNERLTRNKEVDEGKERV